MGFRDTMKSLSPALYRLRIFVFLCAGIVLVVSTYYFFYVRSQTGRFNNRNFRKLSLISSQIGSRLTNTGSVLEKTCERFIHPPDEDHKLVIDNEDPANKQKNIAALQKLFEGLKDDSLQITPFNIVSEKCCTNAVPGSVTLTATPYERDSTWLYFDYVSHGLERGTVVRVQAKTELSSLIQPFLSARIGSQPDQFQNILIAEADTARVILQYDNSQVRLASLDKLTVAGDGKKIDLKEISQTSNMADISLAGANYRLFSHPLTVSLPSTDSARSATWIVTGLIKSDYFQSEAWSLSIPYTILIIFGFVVAVLVFSWPFLKLVLVGPKDRFRTHDVYLLVFATMIVLAVVTAFGLYVYVYRAVEAQMDQQVKTLGDDLKTNFRAELTQALQQLETLGNNQNLLDRLIAEEEAREKNGAPKKKQGGDLGSNVSEAEQKHEARDELACDPTDPNFYNLAHTNKIKILPCLMAAHATTYPYFEMVAWIDKTGMQRAKWTVKDYTTQYVSVSDRAYFQNIQKKHFYEFAGHKFWLQPIVSRTTGRNQVEISQQVKNSDWTIAFDTRLLSLMDPVVPDGFGYLIINNEGDVLFHSDEVHHLGENLLQECDDNRELRSAIIGRTNSEMDASYSGQDHRLFVTTLEGFPDWSIVAFRSKQPLRSVFLELMTSLTALFLIHMLMLMGAFTLFYFAYTRNRRKAWLWPERRKMDLYKQLSYLLLLLSFVSLMLALFLHGKWLVWVIAALSWLAAVVFFFSLRWGPWSWAKIQQLIANLVFRTKPPSTPTQPVKQPSEPVIFERGQRLLKRYDGVYALNLMLLVLLLAIVPMGAFFKYEYESQIKLFIKHVQFLMATAVQRRDERILAHYANVPQLVESNCPDKSHTHETNILTRRLNESWDVYDGFFYTTVRQKTEVAPTPPDSDWLSRLRALLPASNQAAIERRGILASSAVMGVCNWASISNDGLMVNLNASAGKPAWPWRRLSTSVPILRASVLPAIAALVLAVLLLSLMHFMVRKVFLLDVHKPSSSSLKRFLCDKIDRHAFVVVNAPFFRKTRFKGARLYLEKFSDLAKSIRWNDKFDDTKWGEVDVIALDEFEYQIEDARLNKRRLNLLCELVKNEKKKKLVLFSTVEPSEYKFGKAQANGIEDGAGEWAEVIIRNFVTEYAEDTDDRIDFDVAEADNKSEEEDEDKLSFKQRVDKQRKRIMGDLRGRKPEEVESLINTVYMECAPRVPLQDVGVHILQFSDFVELSKEHLIGRIAAQARAYYNFLWRSCSDGEKQTLCHLAQDGRLSHRDPDIQALLRRELIIKGEGLLLFNESFRRFLLANEQRADIAEHDQKASEESLWQTLKVPILVTMIFVAGFLFWTQQDVFSSSLAVVTGVTGLVSAIFKLMSVFHVEDGSRSAK